jgi:hypothetical protein
MRKTIPTILFGEEVHEDHVRRVLQLASDAGYAELLRKALQSYALAVHGQRATIIRRVLLHSSNALINYEEKVFQQSEFPDLNNWTSTVNPGGSGQFEEIESQINLGYLAAVVLGGVGVYCGWIIGKNL